MVFPSAQGVSQVSCAYWQFLSFLLCNYCLYILPFKKMAFVISFEDY